jgi:hypothetical protein
MKIQISFNINEYFATKRRMPAVIPVEIHIYLPYLWKPVTKTRVRFKTNKFYNRLNNALRNRKLMYYFYT